MPPRPAPRPAYAFGGGGYNTMRPNNKQTKRAEEDRDQAVKDLARTNLALERAIAGGRALRAELQQANANVARALQTTTANEETKTELLDLLSKYDDFTAKWSKAYDARNNNVTHTKWFKEAQNAASEFGYNKSTKLSMGRLMKFMNARILYELRKLTRELKSAK